MRFGNTDQPGSENGLKTAPRLVGQLLKHSAYSEVIAFNRLMSAPWLTDGADIPAKIIELLSRADHCPVFVFFFWCTATGDHPINNTLFHSGNPTIVFAPLSVTKVVNALAAAGADYRPLCLFGRLWPIPERIRDDLKSGGRDEVSDPACLPASLFAVAA